MIRPMLIVCPSCATSYDLAPTSLSPNGRQVRCARCRTVWNAQMRHADKQLDAAADQLASARLEPARRSLDEQMLRRALDEQTADASTAAFGGDRDSVDEIEP